MTLLKRDPDAVMLLLPADHLISDVEAFHRVIQEGMDAVPEALQHQLWQDIEQFERNSTMPYITSVERIGIEKGLQQGIQQGFQIGERSLLLRQLTSRFGLLSEEIQSRIENASPEQLEQWAENILDAATLEDVFKSH